MATPAYSILRSDLESGASPMPGVVLAHTQPGADWGAKVQAAHDSLGADGGVIDARGLLGAQSAAATVVLTKPVEILLGDAQITLADDPGIEFNAGSQNSRMEGLQNGLTKFTKGVNGEMIEINAVNVRLADFEMDGVSGSFTGGGIRVTVDWDRHFAWQLYIHDMDGEPIHYDTSIFTIWDAPTLGLSPYYSGPVVLQKGAGGVPQALYIIEHRKDANQALPFNVELILDPPSKPTVFSFANGTEIFTADGNVQDFGGIMVGTYASFQHKGTGLVDAAYGGSFEGFNNVDGTILDLVGVSGIVHNLGAGTVNNARAVETAMHNEGSGTVDNMVGVAVLTSENSGGGVITNNYGIFVFDQTEGVNNWAIFSGAGKVEHYGDTLLHATLTVNGNAAFGTATPLTSVGMFVEPTTLLTAFQFGVLSAPQINSSGTSEGAAFVGRVDTAASAFTVNATVCFHAVDGVKGAGSTITTQYGIYIDALTVGAANIPIYSAATGPSTLSGSLSVAGLASSAAVEITGAGGLPAATGTNLWIAGALGSPHIGRIYVGDGSGWQLEFAKRTGSVDTVLFTFKDSGAFEAQNFVSTGAFEVTGTAGLPAATGTNLWIAGNTTALGGSTLGRIYAGDGTGYNFDIAKRTGSMDTTLFQFRDSGVLLITNGAPNYLQVGVSVLDATYAFRVEDAVGSGVDAAYLNGKVKIAKQLAINHDPDSTSGRYLYLNGDAYIVGDVLLEDTKKINWSDCSIYRSGATEITLDGDVVITGTFTFGDIDCTSLSISGNSAIDSSRNASFGSWIKISGTQVVTTQQAAVTHVSGTAGASYTGTEQTLINDLVTAVNAALDRLEAHGLIGT